ncbi:MAG: hypothetical protein GY822_20180, partial [Deltaproteobacteria bacterium]|nr:hypothetical protein [Deltaproteobacteria bacterium]
MSPPFFASNGSSTRECFLCTACAPTFVDDIEADSGSASADGGEIFVDASTRFDAGRWSNAGDVPDADFHDAGFHDAGFLDAGFLDAGFLDAGFLDAGFLDAGDVSDAGLHDAETDAETDA